MIPQMRNNKRQRDEYDERKDKRLETAFYEAFKGYLEVLCRGGPIGETLWPMVMVAPV